jgi:hypothetical protein
LAKNPIETAVKQSKNSAGVLKLILGNKKLVHIEINTSGDKNMMQRVHIVSPFLYIKNFVK